MTPLPFSKRQLIGHESRLCLSLFLPATHGNPSELLNEAFDEALMNFPKRDVQEIFSKLDPGELEENKASDFDTLCLFASAERTILTSYDRKIEARVALDNSFYIKPLASTLSDLDQCLILFLDNHHIQLTSLNLMSHKTMAFAYEPKRNRFRDPYVARIFDLLKRTNRPWIAGGLIDQGIMALMMESFAEAVRQPLARIYHREFERVCDSARGILAHRNQLLEESALDRALSGHCPVIQEEGQIRRALNSLSANLLLTDRVDSSRPRVLHRKNAADAFLADDLAELALRNGIPVVNVPDLKRHFQSTFVGLLADPFGKPVLEHFQVKEAV